MTKTTLICDACGKTQDLAEIKVDGSPVKCLLGWDTICARGTTEGSVRDMDYPEEEMPLIDYWDFCEDCTEKILLSLRANRKKFSKSVKYEELKN